MTRSRTSFENPQQFSKCPKDYHARLRNPLCMQADAPETIHSRTFKEKNVVQVPLPADPSRPVVPRPKPRPPSGPESKPPPPRPRPPPPRPRPRPDESTTPPSRPRPRPRPDESTTPPSRPRPRPRPGEDPLADPDRRPLVDPLADPDRQVDPLADPDRRPKEYLGVAGGAATIGLGAVARDALKQAAIRAAGYSQVSQGGIADLVEGIEFAGGEGSEAFAAEAAAEFGAEAALETGAEAALEAGAEAALEGLSTTLIGEAALVAGSEGFLNPVADAIGLGLMAAGAGVIAYEAITKIFD